MKLIKIISLAGVFSFAFSAAVWATESQLTPKQLTQDLEKKYAEYQKQIDDHLMTAQKISLRDFKQPVIDLAKDIAGKGLSDEDKELIRKIDGIKNKPKDKEFLKSIATLRLVVFRDQSEDEKSNDIQNISTVLKMVEDYEEIKIPEFENLSPEEQDKFRKIRYMENILRSQESKDVKYSDEYCELMNQIKGKAEAVANKIRLPTIFNHQFSLWLRKDFGSFTMDIPTIISNKKELDELIKSYNQLPKYTRITRSPRLSSPSFPSRSRALKKSFTENVSKKKRKITKKQNKKKGAKNSKKMTKKRKSKKIKKSKK